VKTTLVNKYGNRAPVLYDHCLDPECVFSGEIEEGETCHLHWCLWVSENTATYSDYPRERKRAVKDHIVYSLRYRYRRGV